MAGIDFSKYKFQPVIKLPDQYDVYDFSTGYDPGRKLQNPFGIGKYNEKRPGMYLTDLFGGVRNIHVGIDIGAPAGTEIHAFFDGEIFLFGDNRAPGDYGPTLITLHRFDGVELFALHGHLSRESLIGRTAGEKIRAGQVIARVGEKSENGGWNPHLHFQLSYLRPAVPDLPGVVSERDRQQALKDFPDPRLVLGPLY